MEVVMKYYIMSQDKRIANGITFKEISSTETFEVGEEFRGKIKNNLVLHMKDTPHTAYTDMIESPFIMVSEALSKVIEMYEEETEFTNIILSSQVGKPSLDYKVALINRIQCLHENSEFYKDNSIKDLVLDKNKIGERQIFKIKGISPHYVIVSMNIAESLLRRSLYGVRLEEIKCI